MLKIVPRTKNLLTKSKHFYLSPIDKPLLPLCLTSLSEFSAELMQMTWIDYGGIICPEVSVLCGAVIFRLLSEGVCTIIRVLDS